ncbi:peptidylprolyl isomerase [Wenyingzhuangia sp. IMCC45533]
MKKYILLFLIVFAHLTIWAQKDKVLFKIDKAPTYVSEFNKLFKTDRASLTTNDFDTNLELMIDYKLKLREADFKKIDTLESLQKEYESYKRNIASSYLKDEEALEKLLKEAYNRTVNQIKASHILVAAQEGDTIKAYKKILDIQKQLKEGADFGELAVKYSDDQSAKTNKGELGYFNAFKMVYPFETAAYQTEVGQVSDIVKTRFGYHLIKVEEKSKTGPKIKVAHIMVTGLGEEKKSKIDTIYRKLKDGGKFDSLAKKFSEDKGSSRKGGLLNPFSKGTLPQEFEKVAFSLETPNSYSKPFTTQYGWHIIKYFGKDSIQNFEDMKDELKKKIMRDQRKLIIEEAAFDKIEQKHIVITYQEALKAFEVENPYEIAIDSLNSTILSINSERYLQSDFADFIYNKRTKKPLDLFKVYKKVKLKEYVTEHLEDESDEFKETLATYKKGLVIFELMKNNVWDVPAKEPQKVKDFYEANKAKYLDKGAAFEDVKGYVESDYQEKIQKEWLASLRAHSKIKKNKGVIKKLKKTYQ